MTLEPAASGGDRRVLPMLEPQSSYFWTGGSDGHLLIARCERCLRYQHPPFARCAACGHETLSPSPVSGRGHVATFTVNHEPWVPGMSVPFVYAAVALVEQSELYVFTNIAAPIDAVYIGMPVSVFFERHREIYLPMFRP